MTTSIKNSMVVGFSYALTDAEGAIIDRSDDNFPFEYLHGMQNIVPGLEKELEGMAVGESKKVVVAPEEGYGTYDKNLLFDVPKTNFPATAELEPGMQFQASDQGGVMNIVVKEVNGDSVLVDANHPLAGVELHFDVTIRTIRQATDDELSHGHVHGPHGHHH